MYLLNSKIIDCVDKSRHLYQYIKKNHNTFDEIILDFTSVVKKIKLKRRNNYLLKFLNMQQSDREIELEILFFKSLISFKNIHTLNIENKKFIESFYLQYFSSNNFIKKIEKNMNTIVMTILVSIIIDSEIIFNDCIKYVKNLNIYGSFINMVYNNLFFNSLTNDNFYNKKLLVDFLECIQLKSSKSFELLSNNKLIYLNLIIPHESSLLKQKMENF